MSKARNRRCTSAAPVNSSPRLSISQPADMQSARPPRAGSAADSVAMAQEAAVRKAVQRLEDPLTTMLLWCTALRGSALPEICNLIGVTEIDVDAFSAEHGQRISQLRALSCFGELCSREVLGRLLRAALGGLLLQDDDPQLKVQALRVAVRQPDWVLQPCLARDASNLEAQQQAVEKEELRARYVQASLRRCSARSRIQDEHVRQFIKEEYPRIVVNESNIFEPDFEQLGHDWAIQVKESQSEELPQAQRAEIQAADSAALPEACRRREPRGPGAA